MGEIDDEGVTRLDGNAAAGILSQVFCGEPSGAVIVCAGCGATAPVGALPAYGLELGAIVRCRHCDTAVLRVGAAGGSLWIDLRGAVCLRVRIGVSTS
jgi:ribosomal protein L40E